MTAFDLCKDLEQKSSASAKSESLHLEPMTEINQLLLVLYKINCLKGLSYFSKMFSEIYLLLELR